jgi:hypothetical protein
MVSSGLLRRVALVRTDVSEDPGATFIRVTKIGELEQHKLQLATDVRCEEISIFQYSSDLLLLNLARSLRLFQSPSTQQYR